MLNSYLGDPAYSKKLIDLKQGAAIKNSRHWLILRRSQLKALKTLRVGEVSIPRQISRAGLVVKARKLTGGGAFSKS